MIGIAHTQDSAARTTKRPMMSPSLARTQVTMGRRARTVRLMTWPYRDFVDYLETCMRAAGINSRAQLAREMGAQDSLLSRWWAGKTQPSRPSLKKLADVLGVPTLALELKAGLVDPSEVDTKPDGRVLPKSIERVIDAYLSASRANPDLVDGLLERVEDAVDWYQVKATKRRRKS